MPLHGNTRKIEAALTITAGAYSANDVVGGLVAVTVQSNRHASGVIRKLSVVDDDNEKAALTIYWFSEAPTSIADNAAFAPVIADLKKMSGSVAVAAGDYVTINSNAIAIKTDVNNDFSASTGILYLYVVCTATPTYTATTDLTLELWIWED